MLTNGLLKTDVWILTREFWKMKVKIIFNQILNQNHFNQIYEESKEMLLKLEMHSEALFFSHLHPIISLE